MPTLILKTLMKMNHLPANADLAEAFPEIFAEVLQANNNDFSNTRALIATAKRFEETGQEDQAVLCYALAVNQKNKMACLKLIRLRHRLDEVAGKKDAPPEKPVLASQPLLKELSYDFLEEHLTSMLEYDRLFKALVAKQSQLLIHLQQLTGLPSLNELRKRVCAIEMNRNLDLVKTAETFAAFSLELQSLLPSYRAYLVAVLKGRLNDLRSCQAVTEADFEEFEKRLVLLETKPLTTIDASLALFMDARKIADQTFDKIKQELMSAIDVARYIIEGPKGAAFRLFGGDWRPSVPENELIKEAVTTLAVVKEKVNQLKPETQDVSEYLNCYRQEFDEVYYNLKSMNLKLLGVSSLQSIIKQLDEAVATQKAERKALSW